MAFRSVLEPLTSPLSKYKYQTSIIETILPGKVKLHKCASRLWLQLLFSRCGGEVARQCSWLQNICLNSSVDKKLRNREIPKHEKVLLEGHVVVEEHNTVHVCLIGDPDYPVLPFLIKKYPRGWKNQREKYFSYKLSSAKITIANAFGRLKARFRCLHRALDVDIKIFPQVILSCFILYSYCQTKNH